MSDALVLVAALLLSQSDAPEPDPQALAVVAPAAWHAELGAYDGARRAVELAMSL